MARLLLSLLPVSTIEAAVISFNERPAIDHRKAQFFIQKVDNALETPQGHTLACSISVHFRKVKPFPICRKARPVLFP